MLRGPCGAVFLFLFSKFHTSKTKQIPGKLYEGFYLFIKNVKKAPYLEQSFFFNFLMLRQKWGDQPQVDLAKYDYKTNRHVAKFRFSITCWQTSRTYGLNMAISKSEG
jgi:hypothetical protein